MDWKSEAIDKLKQYEAKRESLEIIPKQILEIDLSMTSIRSARVDGAPVKGGGSGREDLMLSCIVQKDELHRCLECAGLWVEIVDRGLAVLEPDERLILERFYISPAKGNVDRLCGELYIETSAVYKRKDAALRKFTIALYGCEES